MSNAFEDEVKKRLTTLEEKVDFVYKHFYLGEYRIESYVDKGVIDALTWREIIDKGVIDALTWREIIEKEVEALVSVKKNFLNLFNLYCNSELPFEDFKKHIQGFLKQLESSK